MPMDSATVVKSSSPEGIMPMTTEPGFLNGLVELGVVGKEDGKEPAASGDVRPAAARIAEVGEEHEGGDDHDGDADGLDEQPDGIHDFRIGPLIFLARAVSLLIYVSSPILSTRTAQCPLATNEPA